MLYFHKYFLNTNKILNNYLIIKYLKAIDYIHKRYIITVLNIKYNNNYI